MCMDYRKTDPLLEVLFLSGNLVKQSAGRLISTGNVPLVCMGVNCWNCRLAIFIAHVVMATEVDMHTL